MKKIIVFLLAVISGFSSYAQLNAEQSAIKKTFFDFLKFYQKNEAKFHVLRLYKGTGGNDDPPFKVQWTEVNKYFAFLRKSVPYVGEAYIKAEKEHFRFSDSCFKADPEEIMPVGFDYDRWAGGQETIDYTIKWYTSPKNRYEVIINGNTAILKIGSELWEGATEADRSWSFVPFTKEKGKWKMADNVYPME